MVVKVKLPPKEEGLEPVCHPDQEAPIVGEQVEWKQEGTINDGHEEAVPKGKVQPTKNGGGDTATTGSSGSSSSTAGTGDESNLTMPDLPDVPPVDAYDDDVPWDDTDGQDAGAPPPPVGEPEAEQAEGDQQQQEEAPTAEAEEGQEQGAEGEALEPESVCTDELLEDKPATEKVVMQTDKQMVSQGNIVGQDHETETVEHPTQFLAAEELAKVRYACGFTKNVGEFNSFRAEVSIELPCKATDEAIEATYQKAVTLVDSKLQTLYDQTSTTETQVVVKETGSPEPTQMPDLPMAPPPPPS